MNIEDHQKILSECHARHAAELASRDAEIDDLGESLAQVKLKNELLIDERDQLRKDVELLNKLVIEAKQAFDGVNVDSRWFDRGMAILDEALAATESKEQGE